jgi:aryl-alcohol dehydrogenase-like predicted oxidoreductase
MQYRTLGSTGVQVSTLCLGAMNFGALGNVDQESASALVRRSLEAGINFFDTADAYSAGRSEELLGRALKDVDRDEVVLATKFGLPVGAMNKQGGSRRWIVRRVEQSLRRLGTDRIDLYQMHRPDPQTDIDETLSALTDLQRAGKILYAGSSTFSAAEIVEAQWAAERRQLTRFVSEQPPYSILNRAIEADVLPVAVKYGMGILTWSPLSGGDLSGKYRPGQAAKASHRDTFMSSRGMAPGDSHGAQAKRAAAEQLFVLAEKYGITIIELAIGFAINHPAVTAAVIGPRTMEQLESQLTAVDVTLPESLLDEIDKVVAPGRALRPADSNAIKPPALKARNRRR